MLNIIITVLISISCVSFSGVEHKDHDVVGYLDDISEGLVEKTELAEHIIARQEGTYLDIGTGGDAISYYADLLTKDTPIRLIASDLDGQVLDQVKKRHPHLLNYDGKQTSLELDYLHMDCTDMRELGDSTIDGVGASSVLHEVYSYVTPRNPLDMFFYELLRVLKDDGVFVYRDAHWDDNPRQSALLVIKDLYAKYFVSLFVPRFLDRTFTKRRDYKHACIKPDLYASANIYLHIYMKYQKNSKKLSLHEFINTPVTSIDFSKNITIEAPRGFICEVQRHYALYLKDVLFTQLIDPHFFSRGHIVVDDLEQCKSATLRAYLNKRGIFQDEVSVTEPCFAAILEEEKYLCNAMMKGLYGTITDQEATAAIAKELYQLQISTDVFSIQNDHVWIDPKIMSLLFQDEKTEPCGIVNTLDKFPLRSYRWLMREGEEFYFYQTVDEFISYVGCISRYYLASAGSPGLVLCPVDVNAVRYVKRDLYANLLEEQMEVINMDGTRLHTPSEKTIIHFSIQPIEKAKKTYQSLIYRYPMYEKLKEFEHELSGNS